MINVQTKYFINLVAKQELENNTNKVIVRAYKYNEGQTN